MSFGELLLIAFGMAMDSFSVSVCKGVAVKKVKISHALSCGIYFGFFQGAMPVLGYFLGRSFVDYIQSIDHWIALGLLLYIGINMIRESQKSEELNDDFSVKTMLILAIATSIDALTIGISFAMVGEPIVKASLVIGIVTFLCSAAGVYLGHSIGSKLGSRAQIAGGIILILLGFRILLSHLLG